MRVVEGTYRTDLVKILINDSQISKELRWNTFTNYKLDWKQSWEQQISAKILCVIVGIRFIYCHTSALLNDTHSLSVVRTIVTFYPRFRRSIGKLFQWSSFKIQSNQSAKMKKTLFDVIREWFVTVALYWDRSWPTTSETLPHSVTCMYQSKYFSIIVSALCWPGYDPWWSLSFLFTQKKLVENWDSLQVTQICGHQSIHFSTRATSESLSSHTKRGNILLTLL